MEAAINDLKYQHATQNKQAELLETRNFRGQVNADTVAHNLKLNAAAASKAWQKLVAALPDKPMTEDDIRELIRKNISQGRTDWMNDHGGAPKELWEYMTNNIIREMKAANVLYVKED